MPRRTRIRLGALLILACLLPRAAAAEEGSARLRSQVRLEGEDYRDAAERHLKALRLHVITPVTPDSPYNAAVPYSRMGTPDAPSVDSLETLLLSFERVRDARFLTLHTRPDFLRRISWLYPDDGCFARAATANRKLAEWGFPRPAKAFVFGNLKAETRDSPKGYVTWWYHVAPIVSVDGRAYIYDPVLAPRGPLPLADWIGGMVEDVAGVRVAVCHPLTYGPLGDTCHDDSVSHDYRAEGDQKLFLRLERNRLESMGRDADAELGDSPPWLEGPPVPERIPLSRVTGMLRGFSFDGAPR